MLVSAALFYDVHQPTFEVQYGGPLADKSDVRSILQIVSRERWAGLWFAIRSRNASALRICVRQLAFGRLRLIIGGGSADQPEATAFYDERRNERYWAEYTLHYQNGRWTFYSYSYHDARYDGGLILP
jgi:hypothetical protein